MNKRELIKLRRGTELMLGAGQLGSSGAGAGHQRPKISQRRDYYKAMMNRKDLQKLQSGESLQHGTAITLELQDAPGENLTAEQ
ncbi:hypothetical protein Y1Q_0011091 [Alligator mississippiensis]|uniref:Uncharacterized protein n=1 Tax=Alligator mississippiensis TaxID=8496 RepID=A0A151MS97_ALLMI|nr:hypothetical protein Y1Q_0011091 [Alligator mississippiensis]